MLPPLSSLSVLLVLLLPLVLLLLLLLVPPPSQLPSPYIPQKTRFGCTLR
jgi:hypothetical protein